MAEFDFTKVQAKKSEKVPALNRQRQPSENPLAKIYAQSLDAKDRNGFGAWLHLDLPGKTETKKDSRGKDKVEYGPTVTRAMNLLRQAATAKNMGVSLRAEDDGKGTIVLHFQAKPKRGAVG